MVWPGASYWWLIGASLIIGVGTGIFSVVFSYILQMESPDGKVGQMSGMYKSLNGIILLVAPLLVDSLYNYLVCSLFSK